MKLQLEINRQHFSVDWRQPHDLSIPLHFDGEQPRFFGVPKASKQPFAAGDFIGDTRQGGSCNVEELRLIPHCNGTHTECVGHLAQARISLHTILQTSLFPAHLISIQPESAVKMTDTYLPKLGADDKLITRKSLQNAIGTKDSAELVALVIRTLPNSPQKRQRDYGKSPAAFFSLEAMELICELGVEHVLVDLPSVDRADDDGLMASHHLFWGVPQGSHTVDPTSHSLKTITEMIYVPDVVADGLYLLNVQCPAFVSDAAPSRPLLFALHPVR